MKKLNNIFSYDDIHLYTWYSFLFILCIYYKVFIIVIIYGIIKLLINKKYIFKELLLVTLIILVTLFLRLTPLQMNYGLVTNCKKLDETYVYELRIGFNKLNFYHNDRYDIGTIIKTNGVFIGYDMNRNPKGFNKKIYYLSNNVIGKLEKVTVTKLLTIPFLKVKAYTNDFITNDYVYKTAVYYAYYFLISKILYYYDLSEERRISIFIALTIALMFIYGMHYYLSYKLIFYLLKIVNRNMDYEPLVHHNLVTLTLFIINPLIILNQGMIVYFLVIQSIHMSHHKKLSFYIIIPFILLWNKELNLYDIFKSSYRSFSFLLYPFLKYEIVINNLDKIKLVLEKVNITFFKPQPIFFIIYFSFLIMIEHINTQWIKRCCVVMFLLTSKTISYQLKDNFVVFLDVGQGDTAIIRKNKQVIVVDAFENTVEFLKNHGYRKIDYLILTHSDNDHIKEANDILAYIKVDVLILSGYDTYPLQHPNIIYISDYSFHDKTGITFLGPVKNQGSKNNNSIVFSINLDNKTFLFTGDIEESAETLYANLYQKKLKTDYLKVAHHGSKTSTTKEFLYYANPSKAIISVGLKNRYLFPSEVVMNRLNMNSIQVFKTSDNGAITYNYYFFKNSF